MDDTTEDRKNGLSSGAIMDAHVRSEIEGLVLDETLAAHLKTWDGKNATREQRVQFLTDMLKSRNRANPL